MSYLHKLNLNKVTHRSLRASPVLLSATTTFHDWCPCHAYLMSIPYLYLVYSIPIPCLFYSNILSIYTYIMFISCLYHVYSIPVPCLYHAYIMSISCLYHVYSIPDSCLPHETKLSEIADNFTMIIPKSCETFYITWFHSCITFVRAVFAINIGRQHTKQNIKLSAQEH